MSFCTADKLLSRPNKSVDASIISHEQIKHLITFLEQAVTENIEGDVVEFGCYVGESSKYLRMMLDELKSNKELHVYDSFEGLPQLSEHEKNTAWRPGTLKSTVEILEQNFEQNGLKKPVITKGWFKDVADADIPSKISFAFLDGDFYESIYDSLQKIYDRVSDGGFIVFHDYKRPDLPGVEKAAWDFFYTKNVFPNITVVCEQLGVYRKNATVKVITETPKYENPITLVTGIWDLGRGQLTEGWSRNYSHYLDNFNKLLQVENNLIIFGDKELRDIVYKVRSDKNTQFIERPLEWFKDNQYYPLIQKLRTDPNWFNLAGWLTESTQAKLDMYNPLVMSKMFMLNDAKIMDKFDSKFLFWLDGGITNTVHPGYFTHDKVFNNLEKYITKFSFICFPYEANNEIHGFKFDEINKLAGTTVKKVARGGLFGGPKDSISDINTIYYNLLMGTLDSGLMGTEESIFSIITYKYGDKVNYFEINSDGLLGTFFENLKNNNITVLSESNNATSSIVLNTNNTGLYVITFNSPNQFKTLIHSMNLYDKEFILKPKKYLLDNSTDASTFEQYKKLCEEHNFTHIKKDNLGICGGRQFIAEHAESENLDFYFFFEDDMFFYLGQEDTCKNGFNRRVENIYANSLKIINENNFDFLKLSFTEFYGDNKTQWSWYNVPQAKRDEYWPDYNKLPQMGLDPNAPKTVYHHIGCANNIPFASGEVYYCNWPQVVSRSGNRKMFIDVKWANPYEQTWMSYMYQLTKEKDLNSGILLISPIEHNRFEYYEGSLRREN